VEVRNSFSQTDEAMKKVKKDPSLYYSVEILFADFVIVVEERLVVVVVEKSEVVEFEFEEVVVVGRLVVAVTEDK